jgi:hypothetical protein
MMIVVLTGCETADEMLEPTTFDEVEQYGNPVILGEPIENAYATSVMKEALANLLGSGRVSEVPEITTTHLYVRMLPKNREEVDLIHEDSLELFSYPLLYEIEEGGNYYHDPSIPEGKPTWQYTVVPVGFDFPAVEYEVLDELYFGDDEHNEGGRIDPYLWDALEYEAMRITDNIPEDDNGRLEGKYNPSGTVKVEEWIRRDNNVNQLNTGTLNVRGVKVRARWSVNIKSTYTNEWGYYKLPEFRYKVNYSIEFERKNVKVTNNMGFSLNYNGPKQSSPWHPVFRRNNNNLEWVGCTIVNASTDFMNLASSNGLRKPGDISTFQTCKIRPKFENDGSHAFGVVRHLTPYTQLLVRNDVILYTENNEGQRATNQLHRLVMHEMGHVTHYINDASKAGLSVGIVGESWATAVEYFFTLPRYPDIVTANDRFDIFGNLILNLVGPEEGENDKSRTDIEDGGDNNWKYTCYFIDLNDATNQNVIFNNNDFAFDAVQDYSLFQMQMALKNEHTLQGVSTYLTDNYANALEGNNPALVNFYLQIQNDN